MKAGLVHDQFLPSKPTNPPSIQFLTNSLLLRNLYGIGNQRKDALSNWPNVNQGELELQEQLDLTIHTAGLLSPLGNKGKDFNYQQGKVFESNWKRNPPLFLSKVVLGLIWLHRQQVKTYENCKAFKGDH